MKCKMFCGNDENKKFKIKEKMTYEVMNLDVEDQGNNASSCKHDEFMSK